MFAWRYLLYPPVWDSKKKKEKSGVSIFSFRVPLEYQNSQVWYPATLEYMQATSPSASPRLCIVVCPFLTADSRPCLKYILVALGRFY